jgi:hypothetical protein
MKTPGVYIVEQNAFGNSVVELETAVPVFVGYTEKADNRGKPLTKIPTRITSLVEYSNYFGAGPTPQFKLTDTTPAQAKIDAKQLQAAAADALKNAKALATQAQSAAGSAQKSATGLAAKPSDQANQAADQAATDTVKAANAAKLSADAAKLAADKYADALTTQAALQQATRINNQALADAAAAAQTAATAAVVEANGGNPQMMVRAAVALQAAASRLADATFIAITPPPVPGAPAPSFTLAQDPATRFLLFYSMMLFFQNGGGACYVVSVGDYDDTPDSRVLASGIDLLMREQEPTMLAIPDAVLLSEPDCIAVQQAMLEHCGLKTRSRVAILDVYNGYLAQDDPSGDVVLNFRNDIGTNQLDFAAAYYPWVNSSVVLASDLGTQHISNPDALSTLLKRSLDPTQKDLDAMLKLIDAIPAPVTASSGYTQDILNKALVKNSPLYVRVLTEMQRQLNLLPPSAAMAGVYTMVDTTRGVWKAPANVSLNGVISPAVNITNDEQEDLNVTPQGKSINAIRTFVGEGTLVWGARTLDGNSLDWRYVNVRRTMVFLEQSIKLATKAYVFENNVANTWVTIKGMIRNFLTSVWKRGGLQGAVPDDAFQIFCGLGETMTADDILEGILRVTVMVAVTHPAEFIEITFQQQLAKS